MTVMQIHIPVSYTHLDVYKRQTLAFAEIIAGMMSNELVGSHKFGVGQSVTANHLRPVKCEGSLTALGTLLVKGKTSHVLSLIHI